MQITLKSLAGDRKISIQIEPHKSVFSLKLRLYASDGFQPDQQTLIFRNQRTKETYVLKKNGKSLSSYGIQDDDVITVLLKIRGGRIHFGNVLKSCPFPNEAIESIDVLYRERMLCKNDNRPLVLLFAGVGIGNQAMLAQNLAQYSHSLFTGEELMKNSTSYDNFIRYDMNDYHEQSQVANFIYETNNVIIPKITNCAGVVVLFEQIEQAHPDTFNAIQKLYNQAHNFKNTIFIMTSRVAQAEMIDYYQSKLQHAKRPSDSVIDANFKTDTILPIINSQFKRAGFIDRIDKLVCCLPLIPKEVENFITEKILMSISDIKIQHHKSIMLDSISQEVVDFLHRKYSVEYESRTVVQHVKLQVMDKLINDIDDCKISLGALIKLRMISNDVLGYSVLYDDSDENVQ